MLLEVRQIRVRYDRAVALDDLSLAANEGEIVAVIGRNGAGKSTLLKAISGMVAVDRGSIMFDGERIDRLSTQAIVAKGVAHAPEGRRVFGDLSVHDNLRLGGYTRRSGEIAADIEKMFGMFPRLLERRKQLAGSLSGGEQQMLTIARALMSRPRLLLLDEPSMGLSPIMMKEIAAIIRNVNAREGLSIILVEQNSEIALYVSDRGYVLEAGHVLRQGDTDALLRDACVKQAYLG